MALRDRSRLCLTIELCIRSNRESRAERAFAEGITKVAVNNDEERHRRQASALSVENICKPPRQGASFLVTFGDFCGGIEIPSVID